MKLRIKEARIRAGKKQWEVAEAVGISQPYYTQIEKGGRRLNAELQGKIGKALGVDPASLVDYDAPEESDEEYLLETFRRLNSSEREVWLELARTFASRNREKH